METIKDIVCDMREEGHTGPSCCLEWVGAKIRAYADRIEAANKRNVAELEKELEDYRSNCEFNHNDRKKKLVQINELQCEVAELRNENAKLKAALEPVLECKYRKYHDGMIVWDGNPRCAVLKSQQIYKEGANK